MELLFKQQIGTLRVSVTIPVDECEEWEITHAYESGNGTLVLMKNYDLVAVYQCDCWIDLKPISPDDNGPFEESLDAK